MKKIQKINNLEKIASSYFFTNLEGINEKYHLFVRDEILKYCHGDYALEMGCGKGLWTKKLINIFPFLDIVDGSSILLKNIEKKYIKDKKNIKTIECLFEEYKPKSKYDNIFMTYILEHIDNPVKLLKKSKTWLNSNGSIFIAVPNSESLHRILACKMKIINSTKDLSENDILVGHKRVYDLKLLKKQVKESGLSIIRIKGIGLKPFSLKQLAKYNSNLIDALLETGKLIEKYAAYLFLEVKN